MSLCLRASSFTMQNKVLESLFIEVSDHHLIVTKIKIKLKKLPGKKTREVINTDRLKENQNRQKYEVELSNRLAILKNLERTQEIQGNQEDEDLISTIDTKWQSWRNIILETGENLGLQKRKQERGVDLYGNVESNR